MRDETKMGIEWDASEGMWQVVVEYADIRADEDLDMGEQFFTIGEAAAYLLDVKIAYERWKFARIKRELDRERDELGAIELQTLLANTQRRDLQELKRQFKETTEALRAVLRSELGKD